MAKVYTLPTTRAQREALFKLFCRDAPYHEFGGLKFSGLNLIRRRVAYRAFRKGFRHCIGGYIGGEWHGMFLGIEKDGYTHS